MEEKRTKGTPEINQGLNEGNPNTERTPVGNDRVEGITGGVNQSNYEDQQDGTTKGTVADPDDQEVSTQ